MLFPPVKLTLAIGLTVLASAARADVDFNRDIRPILSDKCYHCHGPDSKNQKSDFRIDTREHAMEDLDGVRGIVPGEIKSSEVHLRIRLPNDDDDVMPPLDSNRILSNREKDLLDAWIKQGAKYDVHWSFKKPVKVDLPTLKGSALSERVHNEIDAFIFARLEEEGLRPQPEADLETRLRRAALTLTGLPPKKEDMERALAEPDSAAAYGHFTERLLGSTDYAEHQTLRWLSAARYADTDGYQNDAERSNWPWRDWVIKAFRDNMPFDQFTIEQLAGDLLPQATRDQVLATAFNRNHRQNAEGGALAPEFFVENVIDRVETTSVVWLGLTMGCARCHDHKYDPLSQKEFFQMFSYFNNIGENGVGSGVKAEPVMEFSSPLIEPPAEVLAELEAAKRKRDEANRGFDQRRDEWINQAGRLPAENTIQWKPLRSLISAKVTVGEGELIREDEGTWLFEGQNVVGATYQLGFRSVDGAPIKGVRIDAVPDSTFGNPRQLARSVNGNFVLTDVRLNIVNAESGQTRPVKIVEAGASFEQPNYRVSNTIDDDPKSGWAVAGTEAEAVTVSAWFFLESPVALTASEHLELRLVHSSKYVDHNIGRLRILLSSDQTDAAAARATLDSKIIAALATPANKRSARELKVLAAYYRTLDKPLKEAEMAVRAAERKMKAAGVEMVPVMVMREREGERLPAYRLERGQYDAPDLSEPLDRGVPAVLFTGGKEDQPRDRLELARWLVSPDNPLTARVIVNRVWQDHFGIGLVKTTEDFGAQSELPSHPALLDWLAVEFMNSGWDLKALHRRIVMSATYQQHSFVDGSLFERDPANRLLARGPRHRLDGFAIRDLALRAGGLLDERVGGPPVKPYQPAGLWSSLSASASKDYTVATGADLYRRSLYTYWKRAVNPPRQLIFDSGGREACDVGVRRTNTPLQALVLMNDETFVEAARHLAGRTLQDKQSGDQDARLARMYRLATALTPDDRQIAVLRDNLAYFAKHFASRPAEAVALLEIGESPRDKSFPAAEFAAWTATAHLILNLDTTISIQ